jgi:hypothetical protein
MADITAYETELIGEGERIRTHNPWTEVSPRSSSAS